MYQSMNKILKKTLSCIEKENGEFDKSFSLVDLLIQEYGEERLAERLYSEIDHAIDCKVVAALYGILVWSTSDNGHALIKTTEQWILDCEDVRKISIALHLDVFPFRESSEMEKRLSDVARKFPSITSRCEELIRERADQNA